MITFLDILMPGESREAYLMRKHKQEKENKLNIGKILQDVDDRQEAQLVEEQPQPADEAPIIEHNASELTATGVASLAVVLLLGTALVAMRSLSKKQSSPLP